MGFETLAIPLLGCGVTKDKTENGPLLLLKTLKKYCKVYPRKGRSIKRIKIYVIKKNEYHMILKACATLKLDILDL